MTRQKILQMAIEVLPRYGVKSVTMDDLAQRLSMSKKTIYQHFKDKSTLVEAVVDELFLVQDAQIETIHEKSKDAIEEMYLISVFVRQMLSSMDASVMFDLKKYYPKAFEKVQCHKEDKMKCMVLDNLIAGVKEGYYREDIDPEILAKLKMLEMEGGLNPDVFPPEKYKMIDVQMQLFDHFLYGVLSPKGFEMLNVYKDKYQQ
jgi:AcrR family transcriptional regulator